MSRPPADVKVTAAAPLPYVRVPIIFAATTDVAQLIAAASAETAVTDGPEMIVGCAFALEGLASAQPITAHALSSDTGENRLCEARVSSRTH
jgi:hypothetical protein